MITFSFHFYAFEFEARRGVGIILSLSVLLFYLYYFTLSNLPLLSLPTLSCSVKCFFDQLLIVVVWLYYYILPPSGRGCSVKIFSWLILWLIMYTILLWSVTHVVTSISTHQVSGSIDYSRTFYCSILIDYVSSTTFQPVLSRLFIVIIWQLTNLIQFWDSSTGRFSFLISPTGSLLSPEASPF